MAVIFLAAICLLVNEQLLTEDSTGIPGLIGDVKELNHRYLSIAVFICLILMTILLVEDNIRKVNWNYFFVTAWFLFCIMIIIAGLSHDIGSGIVISQLAVMLFLPAMSIVTADNRIIRNFLFIVTVLLFVISFVSAIVNMAWFPFSTPEGVVPNIMDGRYHGYTRHPNRLGELAVLGILASAFLIYAGNKIWLKVLAAINMGLCIGEIVLGISRSSMVASILIIISLIVFSLKKSKFKPTFIILAIVVFISSAIFYEVTTRGTDPYLIHSGITENMVVSAAEGGAVEEDKASLLKERITKEGSFDDISSGRIGIWKACIEKTSWKGNDISYSYPLRVLNSKETGYTYIWKVHNVVLEYSFRCGWPVGLLMAGILLWSLIYALYSLVRSNSTTGPETVFAVMGILAFMVLGNLEPIVEIFGRQSFFIFYLSLLPIFTFGGFNLKSRK